MSKHARIGPDCAFVSAPSLPRRFQSSILATDPAHQIGVDTHECAEFTLSFIEGEGDFRGVDFGSATTFAKAAFGSGVVFSYASFSLFAEFNDVKFEKEAIILGATFNGDADFRSATFAGEVDFRSTTFELGVPPELLPLTSKSDAKSGSDEDD